MLAALVCGLQLTFWENATAARRQASAGSGSNEMFDLLLFAYVVRCLLEFRVDERESWLTRAAFVYGAAMTNNWAMIGFFPLFLAALVWFKGLSFFNLRFLGRVALCGLAGLSLYLLLPLAQSFSATAHRALLARLEGEPALAKGHSSILFYKYGRQDVLLCCP